MLLKSVFTFHLQTVEDMIPDPVSEVFLYKSESEWPFGRLLINYKTGSLFQSTIKLFWRITFSTRENIRTHRTDLQTLDLPLLELIFLEHTPISRLIEDFLRIFAAKVCLFVCLFVRLFVCLFVCLFVQNRQCFLGILDSKIAYFHGLLPS